jgi:hypothetical protein
MGGELEKYKWMVDATLPGHRGQPRCGGRFDITVHLLGAGNLVAPTALEPLSLLQPSLSALLWNGTWDIRKQQMLSKYASNLSPTWP